MELKKLKSLVFNSTTPYFTRNNLKSLMEPDVSRRTLDYRIQSLVKNNSILPLKQGFYLNLSAYQQASDKQALIEYTATKLVYPSYISLEYALAKFGFLAESIFNLTCITTKKTRSYNNKLFTATYKNLKPELYTGYSQKSFLDFTYNFADLSKAFFDYIYFTPMSNQNEIESFLTQSRFNYSVFISDDLQKLKQLIANADSPKLDSVLEFIIKELS